MKLCKTTLTGSNLSEVHVTNKERFERYAKCKARADWKAEELRGKQNSTNAEEPPHHDTENLYAGCAEDWGLFSLQDGCLDFEKQDSSMDAWLHHTIHASTVGWRHFAICRFVDV